MNEHNNEETTSDRKKAKRLVTTYGFKDKSNKAQYSPSKRRNNQHVKLSERNRKIRRNVNTRAGYQTPKDAALAMIDVYYYNPEKRVKYESVAAAALYAAVVLFNKPDKQSDVAEHMAVSERTIGARYTEMLDYIGL